MSFETGKQAFDFLIANSGTRKNLEVDFFGGEPLMNWDVVKKLVEYARSVEKQHNKNFRFTLTTNGVLIDDEVIDFANKGIGGKMFGEISGTIVHHDPYMVLADFADYRNVQKLAEEIWQDKDRWSKMSLMNTAGAGVFAADRSINDYARDIWHCEKLDLRK